MIGKIKSVNEMKIYRKYKVGICSLIIGILVCCVYAIWFEQSRKHVIRLKPSIAFIESIIQSQNRLPTQNEFHDWMDMDEHRMFVLRDRSDRYAQEHGAKNVNDYMVGTWIADWYYYYKSWDKKYFDGVKEIETAIKDK